MHRPEANRVSCAGRASMRRIEDGNAALRSEPNLVKLLDCFPEPAAILNEQRQIVLANDKLARMLGCERDGVLGLRPGEAIGCIHADDEPHGCGTSQFCTCCGAFRAIAEAQTGNTPQTEECRITFRTPQGAMAMDMRVVTTPIDVQGESFTVFAIRDTTDEKRREVLERVCCHDLLNTAGGLRGLLELWSEVDGEEAVAINEQARTLAGLVIDEIEALRDLVAAERGDLKPDIRKFDVAPLITRLCLLYSRLTTARGGRIEPPRFSGSTMVRTDEILLSRILGNLIKNATEASARGDSIHVSFVNLGAPTFHIHSKAFMPEDVQLQMFQRSFTTKEGGGRGIGAYSVKLLTERYLGGWVTFSSSREVGTTFTVTLPG
jgi:signal transduction histidine kinase